MFVVGEEIHMLGSEFEGDARIEGEARLGGRGVWGKFRWDPPQKMQKKSYMKPIDQSGLYIVEAEINLFSQRRIQEFVKDGLGLGN